MNTPNILPGSLPPSALIGFPPVSFTVRERRSLTVHLEDAGWFDVQCDGDPCDANAEAYPVHVGRYGRTKRARAGWKSRAVLGDTLANPSDPRATAGLLDSPVRFGTFRLAWILLVSTLFVIQSRRSTL